MRKLNRLSNCGLTLIIGPLFFLIAYSTGLIPTSPSSWAFIDILGPATILIGFLMLFLGVATMDIKKKKKVKIESIKVNKKKMSFGCPNCELAYSTGMMECPDCGSKL